MAIPNYSLFLVLALCPYMITCFTVISSDSFVARPAHCSAGQAYWCKNITTAAECRAVKHCIKAVWEQQVPIEEDDSTVCQTCLEMVKEARDQLESNETQAEIRQVLEASCIVIPVKELREDCDRLMDDFGSYLVDTLASQMNPQVVCSVAGLCNNPAFYKPPVRAQLTCDSCFGLMKQVEEKIDTASEKDLRTALVSICRNFGSFSDGCSALVLSNLPAIATILGEHVKALPVCSLAGVCTAKFHSHPEKLLRVPVGEDKDVEVIGGQLDDDLPCELCEQLVIHLRDVLIANTTREEFKQVLEGICGKMKDAYKSECLHFVENYYEAVYTLLVDELNGKTICKQIGICPNAFEGVMRPTIPGSEMVSIPPALEPQTYQLPETLMLDPLTLIPRKSVAPNGPSKKQQIVCSFCEYFLHFVQQEITLPSSEKKIREVVEKGCSKLPTSVADQCTSFVETYMDAFIALLANRIDPSQVCPGLGVCPGLLQIVLDTDQPTCPLCLLAVEELMHKLPANRTQEDINDALDDLCIRDVFPNSLTTECAKFITTHRSPLTDMMLAEFTSEEACLYANICSHPKPIEEAKEMTPAHTIQTNAIESGENEDKEVGNSNTCVMCEFVMTKLEKILKDKKTEEEIKESIYKVCNYLPHTVTGQCKEFIKEYADLIFELLSNEVSPKEMCVALNLCDKAYKLISRPVRRCLACEVLMESLKAVLTDEDIDSDFNYKLSIACRNLPSKEIRTCQTIVRELAPQIEAAVRSLPIGPLVCKRVGLCGSPRCSLGPAFWCANEENASLCQEKEFCHSNMWSKNKALHEGSRPQTHLKGTHVI